MSVLLHSFDALSSTILYAAPPNPPAQAPPGLDTFTTKVLGWLKWGTGIAAMGGLLAVAVMTVSAVVRTPRRTPCPTPRGCSAPLPSPGPRRC